jgi:hypothetical protein
MVRSKLAWAAADPTSSRASVTRKRTQSTTGVDRGWSTPGDHSTASPLWVFTPFLIVYQPRKFPQLRGHMRR